MLEALTKDIKHALRMFAQSPAFTASAVAALTLGIGANTAIFSVVNAVMLRPLGFRDPDRIVMLMNVSPDGSGAAGSPAKFMHWRAQSDVLQDVSAFNTGFMNLTGGNFPEQVRSGRVSADFFKLMGAPVVVGRTFSNEEDLPGGAKVVVLSKAVWINRFAADPNVPGRTVALNGEPYTIVGVLGDFDFSELGAPPQVWTPWQFDPNTAEQGHYFQVAGRLKPGITLEQANARLNASAAQYREKYPDTLGPTATFGVEPIGRLLVRNVRTSLLVLAGAVGFVLLIACANVANLLLVRAAGRRREIAVRAAVGGSRARIVGQLLTESVLLSTGGGILGLLFGWLGIRALLSVNTAGLPRVGSEGNLVSIDWRVLAFTVTVALFTGILFGLIPALQTSRADLTTTLKESSGRSGTGFRQNKVRSVLVVSEVALALVLLIGSALLIRSALALSKVDPGFDIQNVLTMRMSLAGSQFAETETVELLVRNGLERVRALPGVVHASATCCIPLQGGYGLSFNIVGRPRGERPFHGGGGWYTVSPGYFEVFRIPIRRGRTFTDRDDGRGMPVVIINEAMARQYWPDSDPLTDRMVIGRGSMREFETEPERQIIGVVGDTRDGGLNSEPQPMMYIPQAQLPDAANALNVGLTPIAWVVRTAGDPLVVSDAIQNAIRHATGLPVSNVESMRNIASVSTSRERFNMWLMTVFGLSAVLLAAIGIYGLMAYSVAHRRQEIGIRLALGARATQVMSMVIREGMILALVGLGVGVMAAFLLARVIETLLYNVAPRDPLVFIGVPLLLAAVALIAVWLPAQRASRVDPMTALRYE